MTDALDLLNALNRVPRPYQVGPLAPTEHGELYGHLCQPELWARWRHRETPLPPFENFGETLLRGVYQQWALRSGPPGAPLFGLFTAHDADAAGGTAQLNACRLGEVAPSWFTAACWLAITQLFAVTPLRQVYATISPTYSDPLFVGVIRTCGVSEPVGVLRDYEFVYGAPSDLQVHLIRRSSWMASAGRLLARPRGRSEGMVQVVTMASLEARLRGPVEFVENVNEHQPLERALKDPAMVGVIDLIARQEGWLKVDGTLEHQSVGDLIRLATGASLASAFEQG